MVVTDISYKTFDGATLSSQIRFYTSPVGSGGENGSADIPILYESRHNDRLLFAFRVNGALPPTAGEPHSIYWGYEALPTPTNTPTPTSTPLPTPTPAQTVSGANSSSSTSSTEAPKCSQMAPVGKPDLFQINAKSTSAILYFSPILSDNDRYFISYGLSSGDQRYGIELQGNSSGVLSYNIGSLSPNTTYFVRIRGGNGCMPGDWGNEVSFTTQNNNQTQKVYYKNFISRILSFARAKSTELSPANDKDYKTASACTYTVRPADSLWSIATNKLGSGNRFGEIRSLNIANYPSLNSSTTINVGWTLNIPCKS